MRNVACGSDKVPNGPSFRGFRRWGALAEAMLHHARNLDRNSKSWLRKQRDYLAWWADWPAGKDLRRLSLRDDIAQALDGVKARDHRIAVLKRRYSCLRRVRHVLTAAEDPTFGTLPVPQAMPEQWRQVRAVTQESYLKARGHLVS